MIALNFINNNDLTRLFDCFSGHFLSEYASERTGNLYDPQRTRLKMGAEATRVVDHSKQHSVL